MSIDTSLRADLDACTRTPADLEALAGCLDDVTSTTGRVLDGSGAWHLAYEHSVEVIGSRATDEAADVRGMAASLTAFVGELREVDAVLGRARTSAAALSLLDGTLVVEPGPDRDQDAWDAYGRIAGLVAEARRRQAEAETAWTDALRRYDVGWDPSPPPPPEWMIGPAHRPPAFGAFPGEDVAPTPTEPVRPTRDPDRDRPADPPVVHDPPRPVDPPTRTPVSAPTPQPVPGPATAPEPARPAPLVSAAAQPSGQPAPVWFDVLTGVTPVDVPEPPTVEGRDAWLTEPSPAPDWALGLLVPATASETPLAAG